MTRSQMLYAMINHTITLHSFLAEHFQNMQMQLVNSTSPEEKEELLWYGCVEKKNRESADLAEE